MKCSSYISQQGFAHTLTTIIVVVVVGIGIFFSLKNTRLIHPEPTSSPKTVQAPQPTPERVVPFMANSNKTVLDEEKGIVTFTTVIRGFDDSCYVDAVCSFETDAGLILLSTGRTVEPYETQGQWEELPIQSIIDVQAIEYGDESYRIYDQEALDIALFVREATQE